MTIFSQTPTLTYPHTHSRPLPRPPSPPAPNHLKLPKALIRVAQHLQRERGHPPLAHLAHPTANLLHRLRAAVLILATVAWPALAGSVRAAPSSAPPQFTVNSIADVGADA